MKVSGAEPATPQLVSDRGRWSVPVAWATGDNVRLALGRLGHPCTLCLNPETREARLELWPGVSPAEFLAALEQLRTHPVPPLQRPTPAGGGPAEKGPAPAAAVQRT
jgi:hypothetical protein